MQTAAAPSIRERLRWFLAEITIVTAGILIALSLDGIVEARRERKLVREATAHIKHEIRDNKADLDKILAIVPRRRALLDEALAGVEKLIDERDRGVPHDAAPLRQGVVHFGIDLVSTALETAETTGALGHMPYAEVARYATAYGLQRELMRLHARMQDQYLLVGTIRRFSLKGLSTSELRAWRERLVVALEHLDGFASMAKTLSGSYASHLGR